MKSLVSVFDANQTAASLICSGAYALMMVTYYQTKGVYKTRNTVGLPQRFLAVSCCTCVLLGLTSIFGLVDWSWDSKMQWHVIDIVFVMINVALFCSNFYCLMVKRENLKRAKGAGLSEADYYAQVIAPTLPKEEPKKKPADNKKREFVAMNRS